MANMYLICGVSGSGKTYFSKRLEEKLKIERLTVDDIYKELNGNESIRTNKFEVWIHLFQKIHELENLSKDVIIDTNALKHSNRVQFVDWFPGFAHHLIFISVDHETRMNYIKSRTRKIDEEIIRNMEKILETPSVNLDKEWDTVTHIKNIGQDFHAPIYMKGHLDIFSDV